VKGGSAHGCNPTTIDESIASWQSKNPSRTIVQISHSTFLVQGLYQTIIILGYLEDKSSSTSDTPATIQITPEDHFNQTLPELLTFPNEMSITPRAIALFLMQPLYQFCEDNDVSVRASNCLTVSEKWSRENMRELYPHNVLSLVRVPEDKILNIKGSGRKMLRELTEILALVGLWFGMTDADIIGVLANAAKHNRKPVK